MIDEHNRKMLIEKQAEQAFKTICEMLVDRGEIVDFGADMTPPNVLTMAAASSSVFHVDIKSCAHRIIYNLNVAFKLPDIRKMLQSTAADGINEVIVVTREKVTAASRKGIEDGMRRHVHFFNLSELQFNISRHELVPRHIPIRNESDIEKIVETYQVKSRYHFPLIATSDPMSRYLALRPGQLVRIIRFSPNIGMFSSYRCCANAVTTSGTDI
jgi:DNA-directed RNA polymerase I, II, and III subunit RPABC1